MKKICLGDFETDGKIVVSDPCYKLESKEGKFLKVLPGKYKAFITRGKLKEPMFFWDVIPGNFRNSMLTIQHSDFKHFNFKPVDGFIGVDSGQCGFFNKISYGKEAVKEVDLVGKRYGIVRDRLVSSLLELNEYMEVLHEEKSNDKFAHMLKYFKDEDQTKRFFQQQLEAAKNSIESNQNILEEDKYPDYIKLETSNEFYKIICSLTSDENHAGVCGYGAVSQSGIGDGAYDLFTAKDKDGTIIACCLKFLGKKEIK